MSIAELQPEPVSLTPPPGTMRAPTDAEVYRIKVGRYHDRWYCDPWPADDIAGATDAAWPSVSTVKKASGRDWSLTTLGRVAHSGELAQIAGLEPEQRYPRLRLINDQDLGQAYRRGTNVHIECESRLYGVPSPLAPDHAGAAYVQCVDTIFNQLSPRLVAAEFVAIHRSLNRLGYGGTGDAVVEIDGALWLVDWKSRGADSDHAAYPEEAAQVAAYAGAEYWIVDDGQGGARRIRPLEVAGGLIISIKPDSYECYPIELDGAFEYWAAMHAWWVARRDERKPIGRKWAPARTPPATDAPGPSAGQGAGGRARHASTTLEAAQEATAQRAARRPARPPEDDRPADQGDINTMRARWELGMTQDQRDWLGRVVSEAIDANVDFRVTVVPVQRRADIYAALCQWVTDGAWDANNDLALRAALHASTDDPSVWWPTATIGSLVGRLTIEQAQQLRQLVGWVAAGDVKLTVHTDGTAAWVDAGPDPW